MQPGPTSWVRSADDDDRRGNSFLQCGSRVNGIDNILADNGVLSSDNVHGKSTHHLGAAKMVVLAKPKRRGFSRHRLVCRRLLRRHYGQTPLTQLMSIAVLVYVNKNIYLSGVLCKLSRYNP